MEFILDELTQGMPDAQEAARIGLRLLTALICGAVIGLQRELMGKAAGLRTHILVTVGTTIIVLASTEVDMAQDAMSRVIQGLVTGVGFLGAGSILKLTTEQQIRGLTTAAGIWIAAAIGIAAGLGRFGLALASTLLAWSILAGLLHVERRLDNGRRKEPSTSRALGRKGRAAERTPSDKDPME